MMKIHALVLLFTLQVIPVEPAPHGISLPTIPEYGGVMAYHVNASKCLVKLPQQIPVYSWGSTVYDVRALVEGAMWYHQYFSSIRRLSGEEYNRTGNVVRFTQITLQPVEIGVELTDVDENTLEILASGTLKCNGETAVKLDYQSLPGKYQSLQGKDLTTYQQLVDTLWAGKIVQYIASLSDCTPATEKQILWYGIISDYRFPREGKVEFTQLVDFAKKQFYLIVSVTETEVTVKSYTVFRLTRTQSKTETRTCQFGKGLQLSVNN